LIVQYIAERQAKGLVLHCTFVPAAMRTSLFASLVFHTAEAPIDAVDIHAPIPLLAVIGPATKAPVERRDCTAMSRSSLIHSDHRFPSAQPDPAQGRLLQGGQRGWVSWFSRNRNFALSFLVGGRPVG